MADKQPGIGHRGRSGPHSTDNHNDQGPVNNVGNVGNANFGINHGIINQWTYQNLPPREHPPLHPIPNASHTRNRIRSPPNSSCLPGTRVEVLKKIRSWVSSPTCTTDNHVFWLCGPVGSGKSAIVQAVAEWCYEEERLLGDFFFFRAAGDRSRIFRVAETLASQMKSVIPATGPLIEAAVKANPGLRATSVPNQFNLLIFRPLRGVMRKVDSTPKPPELQPIMHEVPMTSIHRSRSLAAEPSTPVPWGPFLIILDGLDECEDRLEVTELIDYIIDFFQRHPRLPLRFLIASRIEEHIRQSIDRAEVYIENLRDHSSREDIATLVRHTFQTAARRNLVIRSYGPQWPPKGDTDKLIDHADGSFIFITTLLKYILGLDARRNDGLTPMDRFKLALNMNPGLDGLYKEVLQRAAQAPHFCQVVLTIAFLERPLSIAGLSFLLDIPAHEIVNVLVDLQSIIHIPGDNKSKVTVFHTSLRDFIRDARRSMDAFSGASPRRNDPSVHRCIAIRLMCILLPCHEDWLMETFGDPAYAVEYWIHHLALGVADGSGLDDITLKQFLQAHHPVPAWRNPGWNRYHRGGMFDLRPSVQLAIRAITAKFPDLLDDPRREPIVRRDSDGLSVIVMLNVFSALFRLCFDERRSSASIWVNLPGHMPIRFSMAFLGPRQAMYVEWSASQEPYPRRG